MSLGLIDPILIRARRDATLALANIDVVDDHIAPAKVGAHTIANVTGLQALLDLKLEAADVATKLDANGVSGSVTLIDTIDFVGQTFTTKTITYVDGQITGVV